MGWIKELGRFLRYVRFGYLLFTSLILVGIVFGLFEIIEKTVLTDLSLQQLRVLYLGRGVISSLLLMTWAAWTVFQYREMYQEQLELKDVQYRNVVESSADAIFTVNPDNFITSWNRGAENIFGYRRDEIIGKPVEILIPDDLLEMQELHCLSYGIEERGYVTNYETERLHKSGRRIPVLLTENSLKNQQGEEVGRSKILRDLTELRMRDEQFQRSERLATVGHMAAGVAHEVGNPLTAISSLVQVLQRRSDDSFIQDQLKKVRDHIQRINKIVRDLVDFSRPAGTETESTQISELIESAVGLLKHDARCRDVDFDLNLESDLPRIYCVPDHIHQVLVNLLLNAVDAMEEVQEPRVIIETWAEEETVNFKVNDCGSGMSQEVQDRIFEPFYTTKDVGSGTGLGLSVSHGIISRMNGKIEVDSEPGEGTTFTVSLPAQEKATV